jgi:hypothetical protein
MRTHHAVLVLVATLVACGGSQTTPENPDRLDPLPDVEAPIRSEALGRWDTAYVIGGTAEDTLLLMPRKLASGDGWFAAFDYGDNRVKRFDSTGALEWASGGTGSGPGEFRGNFGLQSEPGNLLWAADPDLARLTALDDTGGVMVTVALDAVRLAGIAMVAGRPIAVTTDPASTLMVLTRDGQIIARHPPALAALDDLPAFARSVVVASNGGSVWAMAYPYGNLLVVYDDTTVHGIGKLVTGQGFPMGPVLEPVFSVSAVTLVDSMVVALGNGGGEGRNRHLDRYALSDCSYRGSLPLPGRFSAAAHDGTHYILGVQDPAPMLMGMTWVPEGE